MISVFSSLSKTITSSASVRPLLNLSRWRSIRPVEVDENGIVVLDYNEIRDREHYDLTASIKKAYDYYGIGLLTVKNIPNFEEKRDAMMKANYEFASLPEEIQEKHVDPESYYNFGWSKGKEALEGFLDESKGSFYNNPTIDVPTTDPEEIAKYPATSRPNIWPGDDCPSLEPAFKDLGRLIVDVGQMVAHQMDLFGIQNLKGYSESIEKHIRESKSHKARLLYYYPIKDDHQGDRDMESWCTWHNDHGSLTGLISAQFFDDDKGVKIDCPDDQAGLYATTRQGQEIKAPIPKDRLAFQIGETSNIITGGQLRATPHAVRGLRNPWSKYVARGTFAVFMQPNNEVLLTPPPGFTRKDAAVGQWKPGMTFADLTQATVEAIYPDIKDGKVVE